MRNISLISDRLIIEDDAIAQGIYDVNSIWDIRSGLSCPWLNLEGRDNTKSNQTVPCTTAACMKTFRR